MSLKLDHPSLRLSEICLCGRNVRVEIQSLRVRCTGVCSENPMRCWCLPVGVGA